MARASLAYLPHEILFRIACSGPAESALALAKTCRSLYRACYDAFIFKAILQAQRVLWSDLGTLDVATISSYVDATDTHAWARFALADQRAAELREMGLWTRSGEGVQGHNKYLENYETWAPHLFVIGHPLMRMPWYRLRPSHKSPHQVLFDFTERIFCAVASLLCVPGSDILEVEEAWVHNEMRQNISNLSGALRVLYAFAVILKQAIAFGRTNFRQVQWTAAPMQPPSALNIPMQPITSTYQLPVPFSSRTDANNAPDSWASWVANHVKSMSLPACLEHGPWCGYYSYSGGRTFDPPMLDIQFVVDPNPVPGNSLVWNIRAQGHDGIGRFTLTGRLEHVPGRLHLFKTYVGAHSFMWECFMTPFGIVGSWGSRQRDYYHEGGKLWLWKREWNSA